MRENQFAQNLSNLKLRENFSVQTFQIWSCMKINLQKLPICFDEQVNWKLINKDSFSKWIQVSSVSKSSNLTLKLNITKPKLWIEFSNSYKNGVRLILGKQTTERQTGTLKIWPNKRKKIHHARSKTDTQMESQTRVSINEKETKSFA